MADTVYYHDYPTEPIGGGNPYHRCASCGLSVPAINGRLEGHLITCDWRAAKEREIALERNRKRNIADLEEAINELDDETRRSGYTRNKGNALGLLRNVRDRLCGTLDEVS